jgi:hypothetical protein
MYKLAGYEKPVIIYVDSPMGCQLEIFYLKEFVKKFPELKEKIGESVGESVRESVRESVWESIRVSGLEFNNFGNYGNISDYGWVSFYDFFTQIGVLNNEKFNTFKSLLQSGIYDTIQLNGFCIVSSLPKFISRDERGRLHNNERSSIEFNDGYSIYYWHGVNVPAQWICFPETIDKKNIINENNAEKRRCLMEILGETKFAELLDLQELSTDFYNGREVKLLKTKEIDNIIDDYIYFIKVICPSTNRFYYICVPPNEATDPISALSWTFGLKSNEYQLLIES